MFTRQSSRISVDPSNHYTMQSSTCCSIIAIIPVLVNLTLYNILRFTDTVYFALSRFELFLDPFWIFYCQGIILTRLTGSISTVHTFKSSAS